MDFRKESPILFKELKMRKTGLFLFILIMSLNAYSQTSPKFLMFDAWPTPDINDLKTFIDHPINEYFDGVIIMAPDSRIFKSEHLDFSEYEKNLELLKQCNLDHRNFEVFLRVLTVTREDVDWFDDEHWGKIRGKMSNLAWLAKQGGAKGILLDPEDYGWGPFKFFANRGYSFEETRQKVRQRGAEFMRAIVSEYPDITLISLWFNSRNFRSGLLCYSYGEMMNTLSASVYSLFPAFIDGLLDELPESVTLVDASENAYNFQRREEFLNEYNYISSLKGPGIRLVSPSNRDKYKCQMQVGFGLHMNNFVNRPDDPWSFGTTTFEEGRELFEKILRTAGDVSDQYVWIYGELGRWWPIEYEQYWWDNMVKDSPGQGRLYTEIFPGIENSIRRARVPVEELIKQEYLSKEDTHSMENILANNSFETPAEEGVPYFKSWQQDGLSDGTFSVTKGEFRTGQSSAKAVGINYGVMWQTVAVEPGSYYIVEAWVKKGGLGSVNLKPNWQKSGIGTVRRDLIRSFGYVKEDPNSWSRIVGVVKVPEGIDRLFFQWSVIGQSEDSEIWIDDVAVYKWQEN